MGVWQFLQVTEPSLDVYWSNDWVINNVSKVLSLIRSLRIIATKIESEFLYGFHSELNVNALKKYLYSILSLQGRKIIYPGSEICLTTLIIYTNRNKKISVPTKEV